MSTHAALALAALFGSAATAGTLSGAGRAIDGDSLRVGDTEVRLFGIDAPELNQSCERAGRSWACGSAAADQLAKLVNGKQVSCVTTGIDRYGRTVARCRAGGTDLNRLMVSSGYALAYRRYSMDYIPAEESAKAYKRGIWSGTYELPSKVRHAGEDYVIRKVVHDPSNTSARRARSAVRPRQLTGGCNIKGNHSRKGEWIYHLPGMPFYAQTRAEEMFCTEAEARAAGYRRSRADRHR